MIEFSLLLTAMDPVRIGDPMVYEILEMTADPFVMFWP